jgi:hypothetical protein
MSRKVKPERPPPANGPGYDQEATNLLVLDQRGSELPRQYLE